MKSEEITYYNALQLLSKATNILKVKCTVLIDHKAIKDWIYNVDYYLPSNAYIKDLVKLREIVQKLDEIIEKEIEPRSMDEIYNNDLFKNGGLIQSMEDLNNEAI